MGGDLADANSGLLLARLTSARAAKLDLLDDGTVGLAAIEALVDDLEGRLTSGRAANLDNLNATVSSRAPGTVSTDTLAGYVDELESRLSATRAGYLDNLNGLVPSRLDVAVSTRASWGSTIDSTKEFIQTAGVGAWVVFKNVAGKGVVHHLFLQTESFAYNVRVTLDGQVRYYYVPGGAVARWVAQISTQTGTHTSEEFQRSADSHNAVGSVTAPYLGWRFASEFKVEAMNNAGTSASNGLYVRADLQKD